MDVEVLEVLLTYMLVSFGEREVVNVCLVEADVGTYLCLLLGKRGRERERERESVWIASDV